MIKFLKKQNKTQNKVSISLIAALSENRVIGNYGRIPWHIRADLIRFRNKTVNHTVIMGRKTFDTLLDYYQKSGKLMPQRTHIIITRDDGYQVNHSNCFVVHSIEEAVQLGKEKEKQEIFIAGGAEIYSQTIDLADKLYLTIVKGSFKGDAFFPEYKKFKVVKKEPRDSDGHKYTFIDLIRN